MQHVFVALADLKIPYSSLFFCSSYFKKNLATFFFNSRVCFAIHYFLLYDKDFTLLNLIINKFISGT